eukprot:3460791-Pleurochrysis_carterae.AAC.1
MSRRAATLSWRSTCCNDWSTFWFKSATLGCSRCALMRRASLPATPAELQFDEASVETASSHLGMSTIQATTS